MSFFRFRFWLIGFGSTKMKGNPSLFQKESKCKLETKFLKECMFKQHFTLEMTSTIVAQIPKYLGKFWLFCF